MGMVSTRHSRRVVLALGTGCLGALVGVISAWEGDAALQTIMAMIGFAFGTAVGVFLIAVVKIFSGHVAPDESRLDALDDVIGGESRSDRKNPVDDYYAGNPDRLSRQVTGWRLPSERP